MYQFPGNFTRKSSTIDDRGYIFGSGINVDDPDDKRHPLYKDHATPLRVLLSPGQLCSFCPFISTVLCVAFKLTS